MFALQCTVNSAGTATTTNPYSWNANASLLYIDQPAGTGFSYGLGMDHSEAAVAADMYDFLQQFFKGHPEYASRDFYAFGESYGGHYVPAVTHKVWQMNGHLPPGAIKLNLKGTSVGNGLTNPEVSGDTQLPNMYGGAGDLAGCGLAGLGETWLTALPFVMAGCPLALLCLIACILHVGGLRRLLARFLPMPIHLTPLSFLFPVSTPFDAITDSIPLLSRNGSVDQRAPTRGGALPMLHQF